MGGLDVIDPALLEILVCPLCKARVELKEMPGPDGRNEPRLVCTSASCNLRYPIRDDIPIMLIEEAERPASG